MHLHTAALLSSLIHFASAGYIIIYRGSSSPGSGGSNDPLTYYKEQCDDYAEFTNIIRNETGPILLDDDDYGLYGAALITINGTSNATSANAERPEEAIRKLSWEMDIYDAYCNGTVTMTLEPDPNNSTTANCAKFSSQPIEDAYLRIGPQSRNGTDRRSYDTNDFYLSIGRSFKPDECPATPNKLFFAVESSNSLTNHGTAWNLNATKSGDGFDIKGSMNTPYAYYNNHYNYQVNSTDPGFVKDPEAGEFACPNWFYTQALTSKYFPTLTGSVDAAEAKVTWSFVDYYYGYKVSATFTGKPWDKGAKLDTSGDAIATIGEAKRFRKHIKESFIARNLKWIILAIAIAAALALGWCIFSCVRRCKKKREAKAHRAMVDQLQPKEPAWQQY